MRVKPAPKPRNEAKYIRLIILDQEIKELRPSFPVTAPFPIRPEFYGNGVATFLNQLDSHSQTVKAGESTHHHFEELRVKTLYLPACERGESTPHQDPQAIPGPPQRRGARLRPIAPVRSGLTCGRSMSSYARASARGRVRRRRDSSPRCLTSRSTC